MLPDLTVSEVLRRAARDHPGRMALAARSALKQADVCWTFADLDAAADLYARGLIAAGVEPGDRVAVWATNLAEWVLLEFALARAGAILVTVNTAFKAGELEYLLRQSESHALIFSAGFRELDYASIVASLPPLEHLRMKFFLGPDGRPEAPSFGELASLATRVTASDLRARENACALDDVVNMQYTSGTTGFPKGVMLTHRNIVNNGYSVGERMRLTPDDRVCVPVPLFHCFGCVIGVLGAYTAAAGLAMLEFFDPLRALETVERYRCTALLGVPTMFLAELEHPEFARFDVTSLRTGVMAGALCPAALVQTVMDRMHLPDLTIAYGLTEASPGITQTDPSDPLEKRLTTVGRVLPGVEARVVDPATLQDAPPRQNGELIARGYLVMKGYYNNAGATAQAITPEGWLRSGDLASMDRDGYFTITGRLKEMIIRGGENISPKEIEDTLRAHPMVSDAAVFGVDDPRLGEEVAVAIRLKPGESAQVAEIQEFVRARLASFKVPRRVFFVEAFPQTASGKIQKFRLREIYGKC